MGRSLKIVELSIHIKIEGIMNKRVWNNVARYQCDFVQKRDSLHDKIKTKTDWFLY